MPERFVRNLHAHGATRGIDAVQKEFRVAKKDRD
jgi:hypothetical protein